MGLVKYERKERSKKERVMTRNTGYKEKVRTGRNFFAVRYDLKKNCITKYIERKKRYKAGPRTGSEVTGGEETVSLWRRIKQHGKSRHASLAEKKMQEGQGTCISI